MWHKTLNEKDKKKTTRYPGKRKKERKKDTV